MSEKKTKKTKPSVKEEEEEEKENIELELAPLSSDEESEYDTSFVETSLEDEEQEGDLDQSSFLADIVGLNIDAFTTRTYEYFNLLIDMCTYVFHPEIAIYKAMDVTGEKGWDAKMKKIYDDWFIAFDSLFTSGAGQKDVDTGNAEAMVAILRKNTDRTLAFCRDLKRAKTPEDYSTVNSEFLFGIEHIIFGVHRDNISRLFAFASSWVDTKLEEKETTAQKRALIDLRDLMLVNIGDEDARVRFQELFVIAGAKIQNKADLREREELKNILYSVRDIIEKYVSDAEIRSSLQTKRIKITKMDTVSVTRDEQKKAHKDIQYLIDRTMYEKQHSDSKLKEKLQELLALADSYHEKSSSMDEIEHNDLVNKLLDEVGSIVPEISIDSLVGLFDSINKNIQLQNLDPLNKEHTISIFSIAERWKDVMDLFVPNMPMLAMQASHETKFKTVLMTSKTLPNLGRVFDLEAVVHNSNIEKKDRYRLEATIMNSENDELRGGIKAKFSPATYSLMMNKLVEIRNSEQVLEDIGRQQLGTFAIRKISLGTNLGTYTGRVYFRGLDRPVNRKEWTHITEVSDVFETDGEKRVIWVDGKEYTDAKSKTVRSWAATCNHKWQYPGDYSILAKELYPFFASVSMEENGEMIALRPIEKGEEIFLDYGEGYWESKGIRPKWSLSTLLKDTINPDAISPLFLQAIAHYISVSDITGGESDKMYYTETDKKNKDKAVKLAQDAAATIELLASEYDDDENAASMPLITMSNIRASIVDTGTVNIARYSKTRMEDEGRAEHKLKGPTAIQELTEIEIKKIKKLNVDPIDIASKFKVTSLVLLLNKDASVTSSNEKSFQDSISENQNLYEENKRERIEKDEKEVEEFKAMIRKKKRDQESEVSEIGTDLFGDNFTYDDMIAMKRRLDRAVKAGEREDRKRAKMDARDEAELSKLEKKRQKEIEKKKKELEKQEKTLNKQLVRVEKEIKQKAEAEEKKANTLDRERLKRRREEEKKEEAERKNTEKEKEKQLKDAKKKFETDYNKKIKQSKDNLGINNEEELKTYHNRKKLFKKYLEKFRIIISLKNTFSSIMRQRYKDNWDALEASGVNVGRSIALFDTGDSYSLIRRYNPEAVAASLDIATLLRNVLKEDRYILESIEDASVQLDYLFGDESRWTKIIAAAKDDLVLYGLLTPLSLKTLLDNFKLLGQLMSILWIASNPSVGTNLYLMVEQSILRDQQDLQNKKLIEMQKKRVAQFSEVSMNLSMTNVNSPPRTGMGKEEEEGEEEEVDIEGESLSPRESFVSSINTSAIDTIGASPIKITPTSVQLSAQFSSMELSEDQTDPALQIEKQLRSMVPVQKKKKKDPLIKKAKPPNTSNINAAVKRNKINIPGVQELCIGVTEIYKVDSKLQDPKVLNVVVFREGGGALRALYHLVELTKLGKTSNMLDLGFGCGLFSLLAAAEIGVGNVSAYDWNVNRDKNYNAKAVALIRTKFPLIRMGYSFWKDVKTIDMTHTTHLFMHRRWDNNEISLQDMQAIAIKFNTSDLTQYIGCFVDFDTMTEAFGFSVERLDPIGLSRLPYLHSGTTEKLATFYVYRKIVSINKNPREMLENGPAIAQEELVASAKKRKQPGILGGTPSTPISIGMEEEEEEELTQRRKIFRRGVETPGGFEEFQSELEASNINVPVTSSPISRGLISYLELQKESEDLNQRFEREMQEESEKYEEGRGEATQESIEMEEVELESTAEEVDEESELELRNEIRGEETEESSEEGEEMATSQSALTRKLMILKNRIAKDSTLQRKWLADIHVQKDQIADLKKKMAKPSQSPEILSKSEKTLKVVYRAMRRNYYLLFSERIRFANNDIKKTDKKIERLKVILKDLADYMSTPEYLLSEEPEFTGPKVMVVQSFDFPELRKTLEADIKAADLQLSNESTQNFGIESAKIQGQVTQLQQTNSKSKSITRITEKLLVVDLGKEGVPAGHGKKMDLIDVLFRNGLTPKEVITKNKPLLLEIKADILTKMEKCTKYENKMTQEQREKILNSRNEHASFFIGWIGYSGKKFEDTIHNQHIAFVLAQFIFVCCNVK